MTTTASPPSSSNKAFVLIVLAVIVAGAAGLALLATSRDSISGDVQDPQWAAVEIDGTPLAAMPANTTVSTAANDSAIGQVAPTLRGIDFSGDEVVIEPDGRAKAVYFLAHWCNHCQAEVPLIQELIDEGAKPDDLDLYAVSTSLAPERGNFPPQLWLAREDFSSPVLRDDETQTALLSYGGGGFPYVVYLDGNNTVLARTAGELGKEQIQSLWTLTAGAATAGGDAGDADTGTADQ